MCFVKRKLNVASNLQFVRIDRIFCSSGTNVDMIVDVKTWIYRCLVFSYCFLCSAAYRQCNWSNEDCKDDSECCSGTCERKHEGTNPRCVRSPMFKPCFADYHCEEGLICGKSYTCCSPYWGVCSRNEECCDKAHVCRPEEGFIYQCCLFSRSSGPRLATNTHVLVTGVNVFLWTFLKMQHYFTGAC